MGSQDNGYGSFGGYNTVPQNSYPSRQNYNTPPQPYGGNIPMMVHDTSSIDLKCPNCMGTRILDNTNMVLKCPYCDSREVIPAELMSDYRSSSAYPNPSRSSCSPTTGSPSRRHISRIPSARWVFRRAAMCRMGSRAKGAHGSGYWAGYSYTRCR